VEGIGGCQLATAWCGSYSGNCLSHDVNIQPEVVVKTYQFSIHATKQQITLFAAYYYCVTLKIV
jgi:hypothetical protein